MAIDKNINNSLFKATKSENVKLSDHINSDIVRNYKKIILTVEKKAKNTGYVILKIDGVSFTAKLYKDEVNQSQSLTAAQLYDGLKKTISKKYVLSRAANVITIYMVFGTNYPSVFFDGNDTECKVTYVIDNGDGKICSYNENISAGATIIIDDIFNFGGNDLLLPANVQLKFEGGCLLNANIKYNNTRIVGECNILNCFCSGKLANSEVFPEMFGARTSNLPNSDYDISEPIQAALDSGNLNIVVDSTNTYIWKNTVKLYNEADYSQGGSTTAQEWHVCIRGTSEAPFTYKGALHSKYNVLILADTVFSCSPHQGDAGMDFSFHFSTVAWPSIHLSHLSFRFQNDVLGKTFIEGIISASVINGVHVYNCNRFINGGLKRSSVVTNCRVETREYAFGGYMSDSKVVNNSFCGITHEKSVEPNFYMNSIDYGGKHIIGSHWGCIYSNNYIEYYYTVFVISYDQNNCINTAGNTIDIFKYYARAAYWQGGNLYDASKEIGCRICSNGDMFMRCNNYQRNNDQSTDGNFYTFELDPPPPFTSEHDPRKLNAQKKIEIYGVFSKIMVNSTFQVNSIFHHTCEYIFAKDWGSARNKQSGEFTDAELTGTDFSFGSNAGDHHGEFICGGSPSMYNFTHLYCTTDANGNFRFPTLHDLQDMLVQGLPQRQLFQNRRVIYKNQMRIFLQSNLSTNAGNWDSDVPLLKS